MWVPQEAAGLCRLFVRDFDGYRLVLEVGLTLPRSRQLKRCLAAFLPQ